MALGLPPIEALQPSVVPAQAEKTFSNAFIEELVIQCTPLRARATIKLHNYNKETGELSPKPEDIKTLTIGNLFTDAQQYSLVAQCVGLIIMVTDLYSKKQKLQTAIAAARSEGVDATELESQLEAVLAAMGAQQDPDA